MFNLTSFFACVVRRVKNVRGALIAAVTLMIGGVVSPVYASQNSMSPAQQGQYALAMETLVSHPAFQTLLKTEAASFVLHQPNWQPLYSIRQDLPLIPASITKIFTADLALAHWGADHRFVTDFWIEVLPAHKDVSGRRANLWVKGWGDPFLTSEEIARMGQVLAQKLVAEGVTHLENLILDSQSFQAKIHLPGGGQSDNPYDAKPSALAANFNTINIHWQQGKWQSAEPQTPLVPVAIKVANQRFLPAGKQRLTSKPLQEGSKRINLGNNPKLSEQYFAQLLQHFIQAAVNQAGQTIEVVAATIRWQSVQTLLARESDGHTIFSLRYANRHTLQQIIRPMLQYSTNFIANQLSLMLAAEFYQQPAGEHLVSRFYRRALFPELTGAVLLEGAGLSRQNQISGQQFIQILKRFAEHKHLLPEVVPGVFAKSGTLKGVTTLAGFIHLNRQWWPFVLMVNEPVGYGYRNRFIKLVQQALRD